MSQWFHSLQGWREFYAFAGAAAATLMGLMFVVMSLGQRALASEEGSRVTRAFFTPIVVFFATIIVATMLMLIPDTVPSALGALFAVLAIGGLVYMVASGVHSTWRTSELGFDDLMWYVILPYISYATIGAGAAGVWSAARWGFHVIAAAMLLLLLIGIRNAWDLVVYTVRRRNDA